MDRRRFLYTAFTPLAARLYAAASGESPELPFRQVHLDFPPTKLTRDVGRDWAPERVAENREILSKYKTDGGWFDILKQVEDGCFGPSCLADRRKLRLPDSREDVFKHNKIVAKRVESTLAGLIREFYPTAATFFNSRL